MQQFALATSAGGSTATGTAGVSNFGYMGDASNLGMSRGALAQVDQDAEAYEKKKEQQKRLGGMPESI